MIDAARAGNSAIAVTKATAASVTGSSAMLSEAIHSLVDTGNQALLPQGLRRAKRPADEHHPFGYGREIDFWACVVAILTFAVGSGFSIYEGIHKVQHPQPIRNPTLDHAVLGFALVFEGEAWRVADRAFESTRGKRSLLGAVLDSKDPSVFTVLLEDTAAMLGLLVAFGGIALGDALDMPVLDGVASILIGCILAGAAILLAQQTKGLLIGESAEFRDGLALGEIERHTAASEREIKARIPGARRIFIEAQAAADHFRDIAEYGDRSGRTKERS